MQHPWAVLQLNRSESEERQVAQFFVLAEFETRDAAWAFLRRKGAVSELYLVICLGDAQMALELRYVDADLPTFPEQEHGT